MQSLRDLIGDDEHKRVDTKAPGYEPMLTLERKGDKLVVKAVLEMHVPLGAIEGEGAALALADFILERLAIDMRMDGAAEILAWLTANGMQGIGDVQGNA